MMPCFIIFGSTAANQVYLVLNIWGLTTVKLIICIPKIPKRDVKVRNYKIIYTYCISGTN